MGKFAAFIERPKTKSALALRGFAPWLSDQGLCPWTPLAQILLARTATAPLPVNQNTAATAL